MTNSKAPWLTRGGAIALMAAAGIALAACSGGGGLNEDEAAGLQREVKEAQTQAAAALAAQQVEEAARIAAEAAQALAEAEKLKAETEKVAAETARDAAVALAEAAEKSAAAAAASAQDAADALVEALAAQVEAEAKQAEAEAAQQDAEDAADEADRLRRLAVAATTAEERRRQEAEAARERAEEVAEDAREQASQLANRAEAKEALAGLGSSIDTPAGTVSVTPRNNATALVTTTPPWGASSTQRSSSSGWSVTTLSNSGSTHNDKLVVYSNVRGPTRILLTQEYPSLFMDDEPTPRTLMEHELEDDVDFRRIRSGSFPSGDGDDKPFSHNYDDPDVDNAVVDPDPDDDPATMNPILARYDTVRISGTYQGAPGHFECTETPCTIGRRGDRYVAVAGTWTFIARDDARALVDDKSYAYFGWWQREQRSAETFSYATFHNFSGAEYQAANNTNEFNKLVSSATYRGPAVGHYAIYQPLGGQSGTGEFTARAELTANFGTASAGGTLEGTVTNFSHASDWSLTFNEGSISVTQGLSNDVTAGTVDWGIAGTASDRQGAWTADFFSESTYVGQVPDGVAGTFTAIYDYDLDDDATADDEVGRIVGAFGATK